MRRKDREIADREKINEIIRKCNCCRIGFCDKGRVYIVPLNFGFAEENGKRVFYFHSAKEGRKIDLTKISPQVGFEMDTDYELRGADTACEVTAFYQSVIGNGTISIVEDKLEKERDLQEVMYHNTGRRDWEFDENALRAVHILKLVVEEISCKEHRNHE